MIAATSSHISQSVWSITGIMAAGRPSLESDARVDQGVRDIGQEQPDDVEQRADENHRAHYTEVLRANGVYGVAPEPLYDEEGFRDQAAQEQQLDRVVSAGQDRNLGVFQHVPEQHGALG